MSWRDEANCRGLDDLFFPEPPKVEDQERKAKAVCQQCPVRQQCLDEALKNEGWLAPDSRFGVWGGMNPVERWRTFRGTKPRKQAVCGTVGGYARHRRTLKEPPCEACKKAHNESVKARVARRKEAS